MEPDSKRYKPGQWLLFGAALGAFIGLLFDKFALGLIFGFFAGIVIDSNKRKAAKGTHQGDADNQGHD